MDEKMWKSCNRDEGRELESEGAKRGGRKKEQRD